MIFQDEAAGGQWHSCRDCGVYGDMIELAARVWKISPMDATTKLAGCGCEFPAEQMTVDGLQQHVQYPIVRRLCMTKFWEKAQETKRTQPATTLLVKLGLRSNLGATREKSGPKQLWGLMHQKTVIDALHMDPLEAARTGELTKYRRRPQNTIACRLFKGQRWDDVMVIPYYDIPHRLCGFMMIGRDGNPATDHIYRNIPHRTKNGGDGGLAFHPDTLTPSVDWEGCVFAFQDVLAALKIQLKNFQVTTTPVPVVHWCDDDKSPPTHCWKMFSGRQIIFWAPEINAKLLAQAIKVNGKLAVVGPRNSARPSMYNFLLRNSAHDTLRNMQRNALPWSVALEQELVPMDDLAIDALFLNMKALKIDIEMVIGRLSTDAQDQVRRAIGANMPQKVVTVDNYRITETPDGWYATNKLGSELICDAIVRIDHIVRYERRELTYYRGRILYRNQEFPFYSRKDKIVRGPINWLQDQLIKNKQGLLKYNPRWEKRLLAIAAQCHEAEFVKGVDLVGWSPEDSMFVLPSGSITDEGKFIPTTCKVMDDQLPGLKLGKPQVLSPVQIYELTADEDNVATCLATFGAVVANVLAPAMGQATSGIAWAGAQINEGLSLARRLGCNESFNPDDEGAHNWPVTPGGKVRNAVAFRGWMNPREMPRNCLMPVSVRQSLPLAINGGWHVLKTPATALVNPAWLLNGHRLLPAYLLDLSRRQLQLAATGGTYLDDVWADIRQWLEDSGARIATFDDARRLVLPDGQDHEEALSELFIPALVDGRFSIVPRTVARRLRQPDGYDRYVLAKELWTTKTGTFIPRAVLATVQHREKLQQIDFNRVTTILANCGALIAEELVNGCSGWTVHSEWVNRKIHRRRAAQGLMRIHG